MDKMTFEKIVDDTLALCRAVLIEKAKEYATGDRLHNFKVAAELQNTTPEAALAGMMAKHTVSVYDMCQTSGQRNLESDVIITYPARLWDEKIGDSINYLLLLRALAAEREANEATSDEH